MMECSKKACKFTWACPHKAQFIQKEKRMNTYTITARATFNQEYVVDAASEREAIKAVESGVDPDYNELDSVEDIEVANVEYGDTERKGSLGVAFVTRGELYEASVEDALRSLLQTCNGTTATYYGCELELIEFYVDWVEEA